MYCINCYVIVDIHRLSWECRCTASIVMWSQDVHQLICLVIVGVLHQLLCGHKMYIN